MPKSVTKVPDYTLYRDGVVASDTIANVVKGSGINMAGYEYALVQIVPSGDADPTATISWWSEGFSKFIPEHTAISYAGIGANLPYEFAVPCRGRLMFVSLASSSWGSVKVYVSGFNKIHPE